MQKLIVLSAVLSLSLSGSKAQAQADHFPSKEACESAYKSGQYRAYVSVFKKPHTEDPVDIAPLPANACMDMFTASGYAWVVQLKGELMHWTGPIGARVADKRADCWNNIRSYIFLTDVTPFVNNPGAPQAAPAGVNNTNIVTVVLSPGCYGCQPTAQSPLVPEITAIKAGGIPGWAWGVGGVVVGGGIACAIWCPRHHGTEPIKTTPPGAQTGGAFNRGFTFSTGLLSR